MAKPKKPFCKNGHEIALVGRYKSGACKECVRVYKINNIDKIEHKQFCVNGHDTFIVGRDRSNWECTQCRRERRRIDPNKDARKKDFCKNGHDMAVVGRINHMCEVCRRDYEKQYAKDNADKIKAYKEVYLPKNKEKIKKQRKTYVELNKKKIVEYFRRHHLKNCYGLTDEKYNAILNTQNRACLGCLKTVEELGKLLTVDHDHACCPKAKSCGKCIRGLLCSNCNVALGRLKDNVETLKNLIKYLNKHNRRNKNGTITKSRETRIRTNPR
jgi:hypothetical protein